MPGAAANRHSVAGCFDDETLRPFRVWGARKLVKTQLPRGATPRCHLAAASPFTDSNACIIVAMFKRKPLEQPAPPPDPNCAVCGKPIVEGVDSWSRNGENRRGHMRCIYPDQYSAEGKPLEKKAETNKPAEHRPPAAVSPTPPAASVAQVPPPTKSVEVPKCPNGLSRPPCPKCNSTKVRDVNDNRGGDLECGDCHYRFDFKLQGRVFETLFLVLACCAVLTTAVLTVWNLVWLSKVGVTGSVTTSGAPPIGLAWVFGIGLFVTSALLMGYRNTRLQRLLAETTFADVVGLAKSLATDGVSPHVAPLRACLLDPQKQPVFYTAFFNIELAKQQQVLAQIRTVGDRDIRERFCAYLAFKGAKYREEHLAFWSSLQPSPPS